MEQRVTTAMHKKVHYLNSIIVKMWDFLSDNPFAKWVCVIIGGAILFTSYVLISRTVFYNADDASIIIEAQSMMHGNLLLRGWYIPSDNFLFIDIPFYALGLRLGFSMTSLLHIVPSLLYTLVVLCSGYLITTSLQDKQRLWGWLALCGIIAFPPLYMVQNLIVGPIHVGTILFILVGLIAYKHFLSGGRGKWLAFAVALLIMILTLIGDPFVEVLFVLPVLLTEGTHMLIKRRISLEKNALFFGTLLAIAIARGVTWILTVSGVHILSNISFSFATIPVIIANLANAIAYIYTLFNANIFVISSFSLASIPILINAIVVSTFGLAGIYAIITKSRYSLWQANTTSTVKIIQVSLWSSIGTLAAFVVSTFGGTIRYLYPLFFLSELATFPILFALIHKHVLRIAVILVLVANAIPFAISLYQAPPAVPSETPVLALLKEHHLTQGLGTYWVAPFMTVLSDNQIVIHQININGSTIHPYLFLADEKWFDTANLRQTNFIAFRKSDNFLAYYNASINSFGPPDHQYYVNGITILAWDTPLITHMSDGYSFT